MPEEEAARSGISSDQVKIHLKYGGGFPANVEGLHHLHCLVRDKLFIFRKRRANASQNLLRQSLYYNFDYYHALGEGAFKNEDDILKHHISTHRFSLMPCLQLIAKAHCLDILRQQLMCTVDVGMLGQIWYVTSWPFPLWKIL